MGQYSKSTLKVPCTDLMNEVMPVLKRFELFCSKSRPPEIVLTRYNQKVCK